MTYRRNPLSPRGFTLIEMLVVLGIIVVLATIAITSMGRVLEGQRRTKTKATLANAVSILAEYDAATSLRSQPGEMFLPGNPHGGKQPAGNFDIWKDADPVTGNVQALEPLPGPVTDDEPNRLKYQAVLNTAVVLKVAGGMPAARKILASLPSDNTLKIMDPTSPPAAPVTIGPVMLDAWGNPIIFVPASGLIVRLEADGNNEYMIRSHKAETVANPRTPVAVQPNARPFFASAGADGDFGKGDDNLYSFQN